MSGIIVLTLLLVSYVFIVLRLRIIIRFNRVCKGCPVDGGDLLISLTPFVNVFMWLTEESVYRELKSDGRTIADRYFNMPSDLTATKLPRNFKHENTDNYWD